jgi:hypothetical protein
MTEDIDLPNLKYVDKVPHQATYSYRLKITTKDGSIDSSKVIIIKSDQKTH